MDNFERPPSLRRAGPAGGDSGAGGRPLGGGMPVNELAELVADLIGATALLAPDKLALVRGRVAQGGSLAQAILDEGAASGEGIARMLAARHQLPLVDLPVTGVEDEAAKLVPLHVLERIAAIPYAIDNGYLRVAIADPANIHRIDELRLATRYPLELAVAPRDHLPPALRRLGPASEALGARAILQETQAAIDEEAEEVDDLEADDGISDAPLVPPVHPGIL